MHTKNCVCCICTVVAEYNCHHNKRDCVLLTQTRSSFVSNQIKMNESRIVNEVCRYTCDTISWRINWRDRRFRNLRLSLNVIISWLEKKKKTNFVLSLAIICFRINLIRSINIMDRQVCNFLLALILIFVNSSRNVFFLF